MTRLTSAPKVGVDTVANEQLWYERRIFHTHAPHSVNVTKEFPAKNADLEIWLVIPSMGVNDYRKLTAQKFEPGVNRRLVVTFDPKPSSTASFAATRPARCS